MKNRRKLKEELANEKKRLGKILSDEFNKKLGEHLKYQEEELNNRKKNLQKKLYGEFRRKL
ncbi:MAG: hypothetical protein IH949_01800, partial [Bacteroidetes bacterium]|nr:hypothetical protein [Bacteroidota bacterium]